MNKKYDLIDAQNIAISRNGLCLSKKYVSFKHKLEWQCSQGHTWNAQFSKIKSGQWCPLCSSGLSERLVRVYFEAAFNTKFIKSRPKWLRIDSNTPLELDGYSKKLNLAFEHHGIQHYKLDGYFIKLKSDFERRQFLDNEKIRLCKENDIQLIIVPDLFEKLKLKNLISFIEESANKLNLTLTKNWTNKIDIRQAYTSDEVENLNKLYSIIKSYKGKIKSFEYSGVTTRITLTCQHNHTWNTNIFYILKGTWCIKCHLAQFHKQNTKSKSYLLQIIKDHGGKLLNTIIIDDKESYKVQCKNGHQWVISRSSLLQKRWCRTCAFDKQREDHMKIHRPNKLKQMHKIAQQRGGLCLSNEYINCNTHLEWKCKCGNIWKSVPHHIVAGHWCPKCAHIKTAKNLPSNKLKVS